MTLLPKPARRVRKAPKRIRRSGLLRRASAPIARRKRPNRVRQTESAARTRALDAVWRRLVRQRAGEISEYSGRRGSDAHHLFPKGAHPRLRHDPDNGVFLTRAEHDEAHRDMDACRRWFAVRYPERWARLEARAQREDGRP